MTSKLLRQINAVTLALIPKKTMADTLTDFRPISCCNTLYNVISHIIAARLKIFLSDAIQNNQVGFVFGKLIYKNVLLAS